MSSNDFKSKVRLAQEAVRGVDKDLRESAFEIVLNKLLAGGVAAAAVKRGSTPSPRRKGAKAKAPSTVAPIALNLKGGKNIPSLRDFYAKKSPTTNQEKITVFAYYVNKHLSIKDVLPGHAISCYNEVHEKKPLKIVQLFRDTKHLKGWLDIGETPNSVRVNIAGENLVEHDLPRQKK